jgi:uncharacterized membrane protein
MSVFLPFHYKTGLPSLRLFSIFLAGLLITSELTAQTANQSKDKSNLKTNLVNVEAVASETFRYSLSLHNGSAQAQIYQLAAQIPEGWYIAFKTLGTQVTSVNVEPGSTSEVTVELNARPDSKPSKYEVPVTAVSLADNLEIKLEAVLKGAYGMELTTPTGRLSDQITEGSSGEIHLVVKNTGTLSLENVELSAQTPQHWDVTFNPARIDRLDANKSLDVMATIKVPDKTVAGDYLTTFNSKNSNSNATATFRMTVKTSVLSGWMGILVIFAAIGLVYYLIRKYGRR